MTPHFPSPTDPNIPPVLKPWHLGHYWLLLKWVYFQPSKLRHYLHQALPDLYQERGVENFIQGVRRPAIFNIVLMTPLLAFAVGALLMLMVSAIQGTEPDWMGLAFGVA
ncbi:MAG: hypothetical protein KJ063_07840, partial [Anaerolineae bacterium]|nr:hypothetical protein [Anaerolineae bacterium]